MLQLHSDIRHRLRVRLIPGLVAAVVLFAGVAAAPAGARGADPYRVAGVQVTGEAATASAAKEKAVESGLPVALRRLLRRVTAPDDYKRLAAIRWQGIRQLVAGYEVERERASATDYSGVLAYRFDRGKVRLWLRGQNVSVIDATARPTLVLPVWQAKRGPLLWDDPNPWRDAWTALDRPDGLVPIVTGTGDLTDLQAIDGAQAVAGAPDALSAIARRYKAGSVVVAVAVPEGDGVRITVRRHVLPGGTPRTLGTITAKRDAASLEQAAKGIVASLEAAWKGRNQIDDSRTATLRVVAPLDGLAYWTRLRASLGAASLVKRYRVVRFATDRSILDLVHAGSVDQLREALVEAGLDLRRDPAADRWILRLASRPAAPSTQPGRRTNDRRP